MRLKIAALSGLIGTYFLVLFLSSIATDSDIPQQYARYASMDAYRASKTPLPTSDVVPLPACRSFYINLSSDESYPVPHWIYSLPKEADKALVLAIAKNESRFEPYARSHKGAVGLMQLMPATAHSIARKHGDSMLQFASMTEETSSTHRPRNPFDFSDPYVSLAVGYKYIEYLQQKPYIKENLTYTLAAYNAGPATLLRWKKEFGHLPPSSFAAHIPYKETRDYVRKVLRDYRKYQEVLPPIKDTVWVDSDPC